jgi:hypothetical protein
VQLFVGRQRAECDVRATSNTDRSYAVDQERQRLSEMPCISIRMQNEGRENKIDHTGLCVLASSFPLDRLPNHRSGRFCIAYSFVIRLRTFWTKVLFGSLIYGRESITVWTDDDTLCWFHHQRDRGYQDDPSRASDIRLRSNWSANHSPPAGPVAITEPNKIHNQLVFPSHFGRGNIRFTLPQRLRNQTSQLRWEYMSSKSQWSDSLSP